MNLWQKFQPESQRIDRATAEPVEATDLLEQVPLESRNIPEWEKVWSYEALEALSPFPQWEQG